MVEKVMEELKKLHGEKLDLNKHHYYCFFPDGVFDVYYDESEETVKIDAVFSDGIVIYHSIKKLEDLIY